MSKIFYDTNVILQLQEEIFNQEEKFYISSITLNELENIKTSGTKDEETKYKARKVLHLLETNQDKYEIILYRNFMDLSKDFELPDTNDTKIISCAYSVFKSTGLKNNIFYTNDLACKMLAKSVGLNVEMPESKNGEYLGYIEKIMSINELNDLYSIYIPKNINKYNLLENQYLIIKDDNNMVIDKYKWINNKYSKIMFQKIESKMFGKIIPKDNDPYQNIAIDSLMNNQITVIRGAAGTGKSLLGLAYLFQELEKGRIDKIIMFVNPVATKDSCKFGFLPGTALEKILGSQIGHFLSAKIGDISMVEKLVNDGLLVLVPTADCRGFDTTGMNAGIYITEAQNTTIEMMKLMVQRIGEDSICIIEGDDNTQVDISTYAGANNGLKRLCEIFKGQDYFGEVTLQNCYRSKIAARAELM